jgi:signal transduction histidine kinase
MDFAIIIRSIPPSTLYTISATLFAVSIGSILILLIRIVWQKLAKNELLKYEFITIVAHKFRTPLTHIKWASGELMNTEQDPYKKQTLSDLLESNEKLIKLTNTLIEITDSDNESGSAYDFEQTSLSDFIRTIGDTFKDNFHEKNVFFAVQCPPQDILVMIDRPRMEFVLQTLLENALHYTPPGRDVTLSVTSTGKKALISVADRGIGIRKEDLPFIFSKFFRTENAQTTDTEGFGVGLYLAESIIRRHKGEIGVSSAGLDLGSTFTITLKTIQ